MSIRLTLTKSGVQIQALSCYNRNKCMKLCQLFAEQFSHCVESGKYVFCKAFWLDKMEIQREITNSYTRSPAKISVGKLLNYFHTYKMFIF